MYDSRTDRFHSQNGRPSHERDDWELPAQLRVRSADRLAIAEFVRREVEDMRDDQDIANDGLVIAPTATVEREPYRTESGGYDVRTKAMRIMAKVEAADRAKRPSRDYVPTPQRASYGSLIQRRTRR